MKKTLLTSLLVSCAVVTPLTTLTSCKHKETYEKLAEQVKQDAVAIFKEFSPISRGTFNTRNIANYIINYAYNLGYFAHEDDYKRPATEVGQSSGNIWFNIPATKGCENWKKICLQAHMDMVCESVEETYDWSKGVILEQDGNILHSKDFQTSIGADDGVGIAIILALAKHQNEYQHGPLTLLFTADEEDGPSGADSVSKKVLDVDYLINIDGSSINEIVKSCAGTMDVQYTIPMEEPTLVDPWVNQYTIYFSGLSGGHSASEINNNIPSAIKLAGQFLGSLEDEDLRLIEFVSVPANSANNSISKEVKVRLSTSVSLDGLKTKGTNFINEIKAKYPDQSNFDVSVSLDEIKATIAFTKEDSTKFISLINQLTYGPYTWIDKQHKEVESSNNINPMHLSLVSRALNFKTLIRSCKEDLESEIRDKNDEMIKKLFPQASYLQISTPAWEINEEDNLSQILQEGYKQTANITSNVVNCHGWLECAFFVHNKPGLKLASIGPKVNGEHTPEEYTDISTWNPVIQTVIYTLEKMS